MIAYLAGWKPQKDALFRALVGAAGEGGRRLAVIGLSLGRYPEAAARAEAALAVAKRQPRGALGRWLKRQLLIRQYAWARGYFARHPDHVAVCWNGMTGSRRVFIEGAQDAGAARLFMELAPFPGRITLDPAGVNAAASLPREPGFYRAWAEEAPGRLGEDWRGLGAGLVARAARRRDVGQGDAAGLAGAGSFLFVPLQVPNDSQITRFGGWVGSVEGMIAALAEAARALPAGWHLRIKEHPSSRIPMGAALAAARERAQGAIVIDNATDTFAQVAASRGVITINSSVGLQAFFHDKPVLVLGEAFFAIPGVATPVGGPDALAAALAAPEALGFEPALRAAFMSYLDQVYYPRVETGPDGAPRLDPGTVARKLAQARSAC
ncbi:capsular polysaccharide export protein [Rhodovulum iodosum]|uniref:Capsular polysaccharide export protein n=1 Tax=Rhodovulum iodosum TaxID=68291 RepID=A0ABV3XXE8_9RHOB|nr:capsular biosynthesis protein [Rhodovulum robiginosum]RSK40212.1 capsular biosynthesis protein [Rhodovulum robiginosum]